MTGNHMIDGLSRDGFPGPSGKQTAPNHDYDHEAYKERSTIKVCDFCGKEYDQDITNVHVQWVMEFDKYVCEFCTDGPKALTIEKLFQHFNNDQQSAIEFLKFVKL